MTFRGLQSWLVLAMLMNMRSGIRMQTVRATFLTLPAANNRR